MRKNKMWKCEECGWTGTNPLPVKSAKGSFAVCPNCRTVARFEYENPDVEF